MITISQFIKIAKQFYPKITTYYRHPSLYITFVDDKFLGLDPMARRTVFSNETKISIDDINKLENIATISFDFIADLEQAEFSLFYSKDTDNQHWFPLLNTFQEMPIPQLKNGPTRAIHFYGYKGGQGRSSVLSAVAKSLAIDGYRVLVVDVDFEAPSLDILFEAPTADPNSTVMGLCGWGETVLPRTVFLPPGRAGLIDMIACRPWNEDYDMDYSAFTIRAALDTSILANAVNKIEEFIASMPKDKAYDFVMFDHRTGMATSVLPVVNSWPGSVIITLRHDGLSTQARQMFNILLSRYPSYPGVFLNFSLDPEETRDTIFEKKSQLIDPLLSQLGLAINRGAESQTGDEEIPIDILRRYWIGWFHDRAFLNSSNPEIDEISKDNSDSIMQLREVIGISGKRAQPVASTEAIMASMPDLSPSGALDQGWFIETPEIAKLFQPNAQFNYIFGRKGTGKTRLFRELIRRELGEPLLAAADYGGGGVRSKSPLFLEILAKCGMDYEKFWWLLLNAAIQTENSSRPMEMSSLLEKWITEDWQSVSLNSTPSAVMRLALNKGKKRTFLIDGVETAVSASQLRPFIESLFSFLLSIQSEPRLSSLLTIRLFLRTDLTRTAIQNVEQQTHGRTLELRWYSNAIFNFALARIERINAFNTHFAEACKSIRCRLDDIKEGKLKSEEYEPLLLQIFPAKLKRNNLQTITFLNGYFSDAVGDNDKRAAFYPRLFETFLEFIADPPDSYQSVTSLIEDGRVNQGRILDAHEAAAKAFMNEVKGELNVLLELAPTESHNVQLVDQLIQGFDGLRTPFKLDDHVKVLKERLNDISEENLRKALSKMRELGIFEDRTGYPGEWRAARLYKSALRMKYYRI